MSGEPSLDEGGGVDGEGGGVDDVDCLAVPGSPLAPFSASSSVPSRVGVAGVVEGNELPSIPPGDPAAPEAIEISWNITLCNMERNQNNLVSGGSWVVSSHTKNSTNT